MNQIVLNSIFNVVLLNFILKKKHLGILNCPEVTYIFGIIFKFFVLF